MRILAEPLGSCADIFATILQSLQEVANYVAKSCLCAVYGTLRLRSYAQPWNWSLAGCFERSFETTPSKGVQLHLAFSLATVRTNS